MLDVGFSELVVIGVVALIVVGPRDLPAMFQTVGRFTARARSMAREFQRAMDDAAKASGMNEAMKDVRDLTSKKSLGLTALENAADKFEKWKPMEAAKPAVKPVATPVAETAATPVAEPESAATVAEVTKPAARKMGAHTRALADQIEKDRAERKARAAAKTAAAAAPPPEPAKPAKKAVREAPAPAVAAAKPKAARKPRQGKTDA